MSFFNESRLNETKELLRELIKIPSVTGNEEAIARFIVNKLLEFGIDEVKLQPVEKNRYNVVGHFKGGKPGKTTLLTGHIDVVSPGEGWTTDPFHPTEKDGKIFGRGSNDMKAGLAIIMECVKIAIENREEYPGNIEIGLLCDEEAYSAGAIEFAKHNIKADFGLAAEPEFEAVEVGAAGKMLISVLVEGVAAHAATPQLGINSLEEAAKFVAGLDMVNIPKHEKIPSQPFVTLKCNDGIKEYSLVVPNRCELLINKHTVPGETKEVVVGALKKLVNDLNLRAKFTFSIEKPFYTPFAVPEDEPHVVRLRNIINEVSGVAASVGYGNGVCDSNYLVPECNIPIVCYGPSGGNMHSANEWVDIDKIKTVLNVYIRFLFDE